MITIAHLSDSHFGAYDDADDRTRRVLDHVDALDPRPDVVLLTGDLADHGAPQEYRQVRAILDERIDGAPLLLPGGLVSTVTLDAEPLPEFTSELPPMFAVHFVGDDADVVTHWRALPG